VEPETPELQFLTPDYQIITYVYNIHTPINTPNESAPFKQINLSLDILLTPFLTAPSYTTIYVAKPIVGLDHFFR